MIDRPALPPHIDEVQIDNLRVGDKTASIRLVTDRDQVAVSLIQADNTISLELRSSP